MKKSDSFDGIYPGFQFHRGLKSNNDLKFFQRQNGDFSHNFGIPKNKIVTLPKSAKGSKLPENHCHIALLSYYYKLMERLIYNCIYINTPIDTVVEVEQTVIADSAVAIRCFSKQHSLKLALKKAKNCCAVYRPYSRI